MLRGLYITDILLISKLELNFQSGLNILTGETGAGKSILLDSLGFVLGWRGRSSLVRTGASNGEVIAYFDITNSQPVKEIFRSALAKFDKINVNTIMITNFIFFMLINFYFMGRMQLLVTK